CACSVESIKEPTAQESPADTKLVSESSLPPPPPCPTGGPVSRLKEPHVETSARLTPAPNTAPENASSTTTIPKADRPLPITSHPLDGSSTIFEDRRPQGQSPRDYRY